jgi:hypothetical protein
LPEGYAVTQDRARKKTIRAQMAASGERYSAAARRLAGPGPAGDAARREVIARADATLAASSARLEMRADLASAPQDESQYPLFVRLATRGIKAAWGQLVPERARAVLQSAFTGPWVIAGIIEPAARRFQVNRGSYAWTYVDGKHYTGPSGEPLADPEPHPGGPADAFGADPLKLLMRLQSVTGARYAGDGTVGETHCRMFTVSDDEGEFTVWADSEHVRRIHTARTLSDRSGTSTVTTELRDFGLPADALDWTHFPASAA